MDKPGNGALKLKERPDLKTSKRRSNGLSDSKSLSRSLVAKEAATKVSRPRVKSKDHSFADSYLSTDSCNTRFLWKPKHYRTEEFIDQSKLHASTTKLGHSISSENSLHAVHGQEEDDDACSVVEEAAHEECSEGIEVTQFHPSQRMHVCILHSRVDFR